MVVAYSVVFFKTNHLHMYKVGLLRYKKKTSLKETGTFRQQSDK